MQSRLYTGTVEHRRFAPRANRFRYGLYLLYLDLDELDGAFDALWLASSRRPAPVRFHRPDYLGDPSLPLKDSLRALVKERSGRDLGGPIRLLTNARTFGHCFNPVSFYYCFAPDGQTLDTIVAEITNTPWGERHAYVLPVADAERSAHRFRFDKAFHVSPFMPLAQQYRWAFSTPGEELDVYMENWQADRRMFDASLSLTARPLSDRTLGDSLLAFPFITMRVLAQIYWQAARLKLKGVPFHDHPGRREASTGD